MTDQGQETSRRLSHAHGVFSRRRGLFLAGALLLLLAPLLLPCIAISSSANEPQHSPLALPNTSVSLWEAVTQRQFEQGVRSPGLTFTGGVLLFLLFALLVTGTASYLSSRAEVLRVARIVVPAVTLAAFLGLCALVFLAANYAFALNDWPIYRIVPTFGFVAGLVGYGLMSVAAASRE